MSGPFDRGFSRVDFYAAALVAQAQIYGRNDDAFAILDAIEPGIHHTFYNPPFVPPTIVSVTSHFIFICVQGTQGFEQWLLNVLGSAQTIVPPLDGQVAAWFGQAGVAVFGQIQSYVRGFVAGRRIVLLGHSLGGAVCQELADLFKDFPAAGLTCLTLGAPRVGNPAFADAIGELVQRLETRDDPIVGLPPEQWAGLGSSFPIPGPGIVATYVHAGTAQTLDESGTLTPGHVEPPFDSIVRLFFKRDGGPHYSQIYAERLRIGLTATDLSPEDSGYTNPSMLDAVYRELIGPLPNSFSPPVVGVSEMLRVNLKFNIGTRAGASEEFFTNVPTGPSLTGVIRDYLSERMPLACPDFKFKYARISNVPPTRKVTWRDPPDFPSNVIKGSNTSIDMAAPEQALLLRFTSNELDPGRIFLHGFPKLQFSGEDYTPTPNFKTKVQAFIALLANGNYLYQSLMNPHTIDQRIPITSITPQTPRGCRIVPGETISLTPGDVIQIGGEGARILGLNGRKVVVSVAPGGASFVIGGAEPVGNPADLAAGCYFYTCQFKYLAMNQGSVHALTTHKVGRPFGERPGRRSSTIPLRQ